MRLGGDVVSVCSQPISLSVIKVSIYKWFIRVIVCVLISAALFSSLFLFVAVVTAASFFCRGGLHFDLVFGLMHAY